MLPGILKEIQMRGTFAIMIHYYECDLTGVSITFFQFNLRLQHAPIALIVSGNFLKCL